ncbi:hypothetical protein OG840_61280 [Streptomyces sp. NBC_01764]|uniref:hypothetical protein n=1 Tax=Streptomyces sp. NBC_01764 TaxID=2975935 RepID=UPI00225896B8|nr:hypothetical protein [Streptomyces sp. NBC_01764]MCX4404443.1 hypothetical protein [Streptomyces sp. NBC_01764]MCX4411525.1 hypothetical protein [Streptomyces sp. NBC_01764]
MHALLAADAPLTRLFALVPHESEDEQRDGAVTAAAHHLLTAYPDTLHHAVEPHLWQGYPAVPDAGLEPSAAASLGGGLWLHHTLRTDINGAAAVLALIAPCTCGEGYTDIVLDTEDVLLEILADLRASNGWSQHDSSHPDCRSVRSVPAL